VTRAGLVFLVCAVGCATQSTSVYSDSLLEAVDPSEGGRATRQDEAHEDVILPTLIQAVATDDEVEAEDDEKLYTLLSGGFVGYTTERGTGGVTVGIDLGYRLNSWFGFTAFGEIIAKSEPAAAFGLGPAFRPYKELVLIVAPGIEIEEGGHVSFLTRLGGTYEFEFGKWVIAPALYADVFRGKTVWVYGLAFSYDF